MTPTPPKKNRFKPVREGARKALNDILSLGLPADIAEQTVGRVFSNPLKDAMELTQGDGAVDETKTKPRRRGKNRAEGE